MNSLLEQIITERNGHYCHAIEVNNTCELESLIESIIEEYSSEYRGEHDEATIIDFLESAELYCLDDEHELDVYSFSFTDYIKDTI